MIENPAVTFLCIFLVSVLKEVEEEKFGILFTCIIIIFQWNNGYFSVSCRYSTMNIAMFSHFVSIIIITGTRLLCYSIPTILLKLVVSIRLWLIIQWISSMLWLIIRWIMLSKRFPVTNWFYFTKTIPLWNYSISTNW